MREISKDKLFDKYGIKLDSGRYKVIKKGDVYNVYKIKDSSLGCLLVGRKNGEGTLANSGMTDKITNRVKKLTDAGHRVFLVIE